MLAGMKLQPSNVQVIGTELAIAWNDGRESYFPLEGLRRCCPCAVCSGEPDVTGTVVKPKVTYNDKSFSIRKVDIVGGYALQPTWGDGHSTGLYSWNFLQQLEQEVTGD